MRVGVCLSVAVALLLAPHALAGCLPYEPVPVELRGVLSRQTFPGPPNYESVEAGDRPETYWILTLDRPVCVEGTAGDDTNVPEKGVRRVQLVLTEGQYSACGSLIGKKVTVSGTLFHAITGHHHTSVLMSVQAMRADA